MEDKKQLNEFFDCIKKMHEFMIDEELDEDDLCCIPNKSSLKMALNILSYKYCDDGEIPYHISPTVNYGIALEYGQGGTRIDYRCEDGKCDVIFWVNSKIEKRFKYEASEVNKWMR